MDGEGDYCPVRPDKLHCNHWYDEEPCCACGAPGAKREDRNATVRTEIGHGGVPVSVVFW